MRLLASFALFLRVAAKAACYGQQRRDGASARTNRGHKWIWSSSSASPRFTTQKHMHEIEAGRVDEGLPLSTQGECVCMRVLIARGWSTWSRVLGVVGGGVARRLQVRTTHGRRRGTLRPPLHLARVPTRPPLAKGCRANRQRVWSGRWRSRVLAKNYSFMMVE